MPKKLALVGLSQSHGPLRTTKADENGVEEHHFNRVLFFILAPPS
jgi:hypothetical protein